MESHQIIQHNILYSCSYQKEQSSEQFLPEHSLGITLSGEAEYFTNEGSYIVKPGTIGLMRRNQLVKKYKKPSLGGEPFKMIGVFFDQKTLRQYAAENDIDEQQPYQGRSVIQLTGNPVIKGFFDSLIPYESHPEKLSLKMCGLKTREALELLLQIDHSFKNFLFDFREPYKMDLENFMQRNYQYNVSIGTFAKLTGRSLSTFKREFAKIFDATPEKWVQRKRLEMAHYLIAQKKKRPIEVYLEVGFENLSHFSFAFKKHYGFAPSEVGG
ncbi:AraC-like DNA-binding protein [Algoriphagus sp. 4150]|uniref:helix-turn-helix domain-containing protein n=1 Tax=Algoriphagus sp. 4150 TaxID=2817756 RepID=UPI00285F120D|nr:AraC family transcriptional regulator [Algoriphagus sp. 4150]MDR7131835.1 AraC-like DNA-binding protein [Algoriphagus sp. 4150]